MVAAANGPVARHQATGLVPCSSPKSHCRPERLPGHCGCRGPHACWRRGAIGVGHRGGGARRDG
eukprot:3875664-Lingulodinium_polyedra.AAC.1